MDHETQSLNQEIYTNPQHSDNTIPDERKTVIVLGAPRGGTTMVAGIVQRCGVSLGDNLPTNLEDQSFVGAPVGDMLKTIEARNKARRIWGWKYPRAAIYLPQIEEHLINPHYIFVWRDIYTTSMRRHKSGRSQHDALSWAHDIQAQNIELARQLDAPQLMISYEKSILDPISTADRICEFLGLEKSYNAAAIRGFVAPGRYKSNPETDIRHYDDRVIFSNDGHEYVFAIDNQNEIVQRYHFSGELYKQAELNILKEYIQDGDLIIDVGANIGNHTLFFAKQFPSSTIIPIEPSPLAGDLLRENVRLNSNENIDTEYIGLGLCSENRSALLQRGPQNNLGSARIADAVSYAKLTEQEQKRFDKVTLVKGDDLFSRKPVRFIKVDAAGHELNVLEGLSATIKINHPKMSVTISDQKLRDFRTWMKQNEYQEICSVHKFAETKSYLIESTAHFSPQFEFSEPNKRAHACN